MNDEWMMAGNHANASHACMKAQDPVPQLQQKAGDPLLCLLPKILDEGGTYNKHADIHIALPAASRKSKPSRTCSVGLHAGLWTWPKPCRDSERTLGRDGVDVGMIDGGTVLAACNSGEGCAWHVRATADWRV
jgi:hypothetical protein